MNNGFPIITFDQDFHDFGTLIEGDKRSYVFRFTNTGDTDLILEFVGGSCGCSVPETWPREPIPPGGTGEISVEYDSKDKIGEDINNIEIISNAKELVTLATLRAYVEPRD